MKAENVLQTIGSTPHIRLSRLFPDAEVWVKSERSNPGGSIKDRIAQSMIEGILMLKQEIIRLNGVIAELKAKQEPPLTGLAGMMK